MAAFFDALETRSAAEREADLFARLPAQIAHARSNTAFYRKAFADLDPVS